MEQTELRQCIAKILEEEEREEVDWQRVETLSGELDERLRQEPDTDVPDAVFHFLDDADIRQRDEAYAARQRDLVRRYVKTGVMVEHAPSEPWWSCLLTLGAAGAALLWWVL